MDQVVVIARFIAKENKIQELTNEINKLIPLTLAEDGCISYVLHKDINNSNAIMLIERYKNIEAFEKHVNTEYLHNFKNNLPNLIDMSAVNVDIYKPVSSN